MVQPPWPQTLRDASWQWSLQAGLHRGGGKHMACLAAHSQPTLHSIMTLLMTPQFPPGRLKHPGCTQHLEHAMMETLAAGAGHHAANSPAVPRAYC